MTTEIEIDNQLTKDYAAFYNKIYDGELPESLLQNFKKAFMYLVPSTHQYFMSRVKEMAAKTIRDLSVMEVGMIINLIVSTPPEKLYSSFDEAVDSLAILHKLRDDYNKAVEENQRKLKAKKERLMQLSGVGNSVPLKSGLQKV